MAEGLSFGGVVLLDEGDGAGAVVGLAGGGLDALPEDAGEPAAQGAGAAVRGDAGQVEPDPGDDVVLGVRSRALELVVDREQELGAVALLERVLDDRVVPLRAG